MANPPPLLFDAYYHIYNRGNNRENIFIQERNYTYFWNLYLKYIDPIAETFAYCLLRNHFHLLVKIKSEEDILITLQKPKGTTISIGSQYPSRQFSNFFNAYAKGINAAYGRIGSLFQHPFGRKLITKNLHFLRAVSYIHQNPQKHGFVADFREWKYSSYGVLLSDSQTRLKRDQVLEWFGSKQQFITSHDDWVTEQETGDFSATDDD